MKSLKEHSKFLSLILRHQPEVINIKLTDDGWANIEELIAKANGQGFNFFFESIIDIVATTDKQRFKLSDDQRNIRANQGHSINEVLGFSTDKWKRIVRKYQNQPAINPLYFPVWLYSILTVFCSGGNSIPTLSKAWDTALTLIVISVSPNPLPFSISLAVSSIALRL